MSEAAARAARNILASMKQAFPGVHTRVPVNLAEFKHLDLEDYDTWQEDLEAHGFRHMGDYEILEVTNNPGALLARTFIRAMLSRDGKVQANYYQTKPRVGRRVKNLLRGLRNLQFFSAPAAFREAMKTRHCTSFDTEFEDGRFIGVSNAAPAGKLSSPPEIDSLFFPYGTPVDDLLDEHYRRLVAEMKKSGAKPLVLTTLDDIYQSENRSTAIKHAFRKSSAFVTRDELRRLSGGNTEFADQVYAEVIKQRNAAGAPAQAAVAAAGMAAGAAAQPAARPAPQAAAGAFEDDLEDEEALEDDEDEEEEDSGRGGCLWFPLIILGLVLVMVLPRGLVRFLVRHGFRFLLTKEGRAELDAAQKAARQAEQEAAARPVPQRVAVAQAGAAAAQPLTATTRIARPPGMRAAPGVPAGSLAFAYDPERGELVARIELPAWTGYACEHSDPEFDGSRVLLRLRGPDDHELDEADPAHHAAVGWLRANEQAVHDGILAALAGYAPTLKKRLEEYDDADSLRLLRGPQGWKSLIDPTYIDVFPYSRDGMPYFAFEFACNWDPEHGFKVLVNGTRVVHIDADGYGSEDVLADGGKGA